MKFRERDSICNYIDAEVSYEMASEWVKLSASVNWEIRKKGSSFFRDEIGSRVSRTNHKEFRELFTYWLGINAIRNGNNKIGIERLERALKLNSDFSSICAKGSIKVAALKSLTQSLVKKNEIDEALKLLSNSNIPKEASREIKYSIAQQIELFNPAAHEHALSLYREVADKFLETGKLTIGQVSLRNIARHENSISFYNLDLLIEKLSKALICKDITTIKNLASPTHFQVDLGSDPHFVDRKEIVNHLIRDLKQSNIKITGVRRGAYKTFVETRNWKGGWFSGAIIFRLSRINSGWEWVAVSIDGNPDRYISCLPKKPLEKNQPLPFELLAPWDKENSRNPKTFMAGGLYDVWENPILPVSRGFWKFLSFIPGVGSIIRAAEAFLAPVGGIEGARRIRLASRPCGFGIRGYYYNQGPTHSGADAFSVDFTDRDGFIAATDFWPVLASIGGRVIRENYTGFNNGSILNLVELMTITPDRNEYVSRYLHFAFEFPRLVMTGTYVNTGQYIGRMQDTGTSVFAHLHFSIHDQQRPHPSNEVVGNGTITKGSSVRLIPIEGISLDDDDQSTCITSSQGGNVSVSIINPEDMQVSDQQSISNLRAHIQGGAHPIKVEWFSNLEPRNPLSSVFANENRTQETRYRFRRQGIHTLSVNIEDALGRTDTDTVQIIIENILATAVIINPIEGERIPRNETIIFNARTYNPDSNAPLNDESLLWYLDDQTEPFANGHSTEFPVNSLRIGSHIVKLFAQDEGDEITDEINFQIIDAITRPRPFVQIISQPDGSSFWVNNFDAITNLYFADLIFTGRGRDSEGNILTGENLVWTLTDETGSVNQLGTGERISINLYSQGGSSTEHNITLTATDSFGISRSVTHIIYTLTLI